MAALEFRNVAIRGLRVCVPKTRVRTTDFNFSSEAAAKFSAMTGIEERRVAGENECASDLFFKAGQQLLEDLQWSADSVEALIVVTQSPDHILPATSCELHARFGFKSNCLAFDMNQGCSGYVYGLSVVSALLESGRLRRALLLVGDTLTKLTSSADKSVTPLFGDAGSATALEFHENGAESRYWLNTDGRGALAIEIPHGGTRFPVTEKSLALVEVEPGIVRNKTNLILDGLEVFNFSVREVPRAVNGALIDMAITAESVDYFLLHQANQLMNESIRKKLKVAPEKAPSTLKNFGNTSSASIPLTWVEALASQEPTNPRRLILCGFGVGLSWGTAHLETRDCFVGPLIEL